MTVTSSARQALWQLLSKVSAFRSVSARYAAHHGQLPAVFTRTPSATLREHLFLPVADSGTQLNQDVFALLVNRFRPDYFVEIGANDGFTISNTLFLETQFGWTGLLVEPNPAYAASLARRKASLAALAIAESDAPARFVDAGLFGGLADTIDPSHAHVTATAPVIEVACATLETVFDAHAVPETIGFISIDVEGGELPIVRQLVASRRRARCGCIEGAHRPEVGTRIRALLSGAGYRVVWEGMTGSDVFFVDPALLYA
jgi:FkbM family methyltransferase